MSSNKNAAVLQPAKFMLLTLQVISLSVVQKTRDQYIYKGILTSLNKESDQYKEAESYVNAWCVISVLCLVVEFLVMFTGNTLFNDKYNLLVIAAHFIGLCVTVSYISTVYHYQQTILLFVFGAAVPLGLELASYMFSKMFYRNAYIV